MRPLLASVAILLLGGGLLQLWTVPTLRQMAGGAALLDTRIAGYDLAAVSTYLTALGPEGRRFYIGPERMADTIFPIGLLGVLGFGTVLALRPVAPRLAPLAALPAVIYFALDMAENAVVARLMMQGPDALRPEAVARASLLTLWKFRLVGAACVVLISALGFAVFHARRGRR
ncbi:hypothetical protein roselon_01649 [Roseibacterium elongatum DSM 19469]|uniref:Uncharacterized protein n=1 Tax=Roseicyclus elongatus DSM 19469 TaxID=1294273 RepID=W8RSF1_9RHOB|nr:hypothetical protein [Roseibacterium elongatum]AHM04028.1 hypothetical protein roselon_01649 [Roseibacterium elongatum DSM 19469]